MKAPLLLVACADPARRLSLIASLRDVATLRSVSEGEDLLRLARSMRPDGILLAGGGPQGLELLRQAQRLRTDLAPFPRVGVLLYSAEAPPVEVARAHLVTGYLAGEVDDAATPEFARAVLRGDAPFRRSEVGATQGKVKATLSRILHRLRR